MFEVTVTSTDDGWSATVAGWSQVLVSARALVNLDRFVRAALVAAGAVSSAEAAGCDLDFVFRTGDAVIDAEAAELRVLRRQLNSAAVSIATRTDLLAQQLVSSGFSVRDTARLTGVSPQRVSQLTRRAERADETEE